MPDLTEPQVAELSSLANALILARDSGEGPDGGRGRTIFLIGAGCSVSAGIPAAPGVARHCAVKLAKVFSNDGFKGDDADAALAWLKKDNRLGDFNGAFPRPDGTHWAELYSYFFESHFKSPNQQRDVINEIIDAAADGLNWAHAFLGELVHLRYVHTVLTTNFDQLILQGIIRTGELPVTADGLEALNRITAKPRRAQVVHLHGSMHTYNLRNSRESLAETSQNTGAATMIMSLLQQCDQLVVVGYGGGEEGIMALLKDATKLLPQLVVYWVTYEKGLDGLSPNARELLSGENKFVIWGGAADKFFGDVMEALKLGEPRWVADPMAVLKQQSERLVPPTPDLEAIRILVTAFKDRVAYADLPAHRWPEGGQSKVKAARFRAAGDFQQAVAQLETMDLSTDADAARLHALNLLSIFEEDPENGRATLDRAITEFESLIGRTEGVERLENILSLCVALVNKSEITDLDDGAVDPALRDVVALARKWAPRYKSAETAVGVARLQLYLAQAQQAAAERSTNKRDLNAAEASYNLAIERLKALGDPEGLMTTAQAGLAAILQVIGANQHDVAKLRDAVGLQRELVEGGPMTNRGRADAGPLENLAEGLVALADELGSPERSGLLEEARSALERAIQIHDRGGDTDQARAARERLAEIDAAIAAG